MDNGVHLSYLCMLWSAGWVNLKIRGLPLVVPGADFRQFVDLHVKSLLEQNTTLRALQYASSAVREWIWICGSEGSEYRMEIQVLLYAIFESGAIDSSLQNTDTALLFATLFGTFIRHSPRFTSQYEIVSLLANRSSRRRIAPPSFTWLFCLIMLVRDLPFRENDNILPPLTEQTASAVTEVFLELIDRPYYSSEGLAWTLTVLAQLSVYPPALATEVINNILRSLPTESWKGSLYAIQHGTFIVLY
jgi:hypothetical protein